MTDEQHDEQAEPDLSHINPVLLHAITGITQAMARSFDQIWSRPDAASTVEAFLDGRVVFVIHRDEVVVREAPADPPTPPATGQFL